MADIRGVRNSCVTWKHRQRSREMAQHEFPLTPFPGPIRKAQSQAPSPFFISLLSAQHTSHSSCRKIIKQGVRARGCCNGVMVCVQCHMTNLTRAEKEKKTKTVRRHEQRKSKESRNRCKAIAHRRDGQGTKEYQRRERIKKGNVSRRHMPMYTSQLE
jgi:hypothetical protein